jgi:hypothetical protein
MLIQSNGIFEQNLQALDAIYPNKPSIADSPPSI